MCKKNNILRIEIKYKTKKANVNTSAFFSLNYKVLKHIST